MRDMTQGSIPRHMLGFTWPLLLGSLCQQLYNLTDTVIVGRFVDKQALAAVGSAGAVMNLMLFVLVGMTLGASVVMGERFGAQDAAGLRRAYGSALIAGSLLTLVISALSVALAEPLLRLIRTQDELLPAGTAYLRIVCAALVFSFVYNLSGSALRAIGDTKAPLVILVCSVVLNAALTLLLVARAGMGAPGSALATALCQAGSAVACLVYIRRRYPELGIRRGEPLIDRPLLGKIAGFAWSCAIQQGVLYAGRLLVQGAVNPLPVDSVAAFTVVTKLDSLALTPGDSLAIAQTTFVAQNVGAGKLERLRAALGVSARIGISYCLLLAAFVFAFSDQLMGVFAHKHDAGVVAAGASYLRVIAPFYLLTAVCNAYQGHFRGLGWMRVALVATLIQIPIRIALSYVFTPKMGVSGVALATGIGWSCMVVFITFVERRRALPMPAHAEGGTD